MSANTLYTEIEQKYKADGIDWDKFVKKVCSFGPFKQLKIKGPDTYYALNNQTLRWRAGKDKSEFTVKTRYSEKSTLVREEIDLNIQSNSVKTVVRFIRALGAKKLFRIYKDCHIFWFERKEGCVSIVIYDVSCKGKKKKRFIEIEAEKGQDYKKSQKLVRAWEKRLGLKPRKRINKSLYEIYSGKKNLRIEDR